VGHWCWQNSQHSSLTLARKRLNDMDKRDFEFAAYCRGNNGCHMKPQIFAILLATVASAAVDLSKPLPVLTLADGRQLKNATFATYRTFDVTVRHAGGSAVLRYEALPDEVRIEAEKRRPGGPRMAAGSTAVQKSTVSGQVFVTTVGAGAYKFSNVEVHAFPIEAMDAWVTNINPVQLPRPLASTRTDADGRFTIDVPKDVVFFLFAQASRMLPDGTQVSYEWRAPSAELKRRDQVFLSSEWRFPVRPVKIEAPL
jgi:hypothetical protein